LIDPVANGDVHRFDGRRADHAVRVDPVASLKVPHRALDGVWVTRDAAGLDDPLAAEAAALLAHLAPRYRPGARRRVT
jgi:hypothetical protein